MEITPTTSACIIHDGERILEVNEAFCALFQAEASALLLQPVESIIADGDLRALAKVRGKHILKARDDREYRQQYGFIRGDGTAFWGEAVSQQLPDRRYATCVIWEYNIP